MSFGRTKIIQVEPGTEIEVAGEKLTVTDEEAVSYQGTVWVTPRVFAALKQTGEAAK